MNTSGYWQKIQHQRFTRRKMLAVTGASGLVCLDDTECGINGLCVFDDPSVPFGACL